MTPLHLIGDALRALLGSIPLSWVRILFVCLPAGILLWVLQLSRNRTSSDSQAGWSSNLKLWAAVALVIQIVIYGFL